ncbi:meiosis inhibitor protein 1-like [Erpetoichthys calabaricus]|uniref:meiosis inhibitor protein 1-like n=1 Tax=Erpetoichthys calabaricus TaxID=27687 RepID=UPI00223494ED|nr:meiosis inhibitor protein 1-like [Erpetoichthys calabaricus]
MADTSILCERIHYRHDHKWTAVVEMSGNSCLLCTACVVEMLEDQTLSIVRKKHILSCFGNLTSRFAAVVVDLLMQDERVYAHFLGTLLGMLQMTEDAAMLERIIQVLLQLIVEVKSEGFIKCILEECEKQITNNSNKRSCLPTFTFLGKLLDLVPALVEPLSLHCGSLIEQLNSALLFPDENLKTAVCYIYAHLYSSPVAAEKQSVICQEQLCGLLLSTLDNAQTRELQVNCIGCLKQLLKYSHLVSVMMNPCIGDDNSDNTQLFQCNNSLPLILKKVLLSRDETLQIASSQCIASILVHSPQLYARLVIHANIPEFLFERLCSTSDVLLWSIYSCLLLLVEESLFFSKCNAVYGIESLVRSLKEVLRHNNQDAQKQGILLFTEILKRQPVNIKLFSTTSVFKDAIQALQDGINDPSLEVATEAACTIVALYRLFPRVSF